MNKHHLCTNWSIHFLIMIVATMLSTTVYGATKEKQNIKGLKYQYAVKFVCGKATSPVVAPGKYYTAINVHNPNERTVFLRKKIAVALPSEKAGLISQFYKAKLKPDEAFEVDCPDILRHAETRKGFLKGFVVIESPYELDIVAVYTAGKDHVETLHTERVPYRFIGKPEKVEIVKKIPQVAHCPTGGRADQVGNKGCCCNKPKINPPTSDADWWPDCKPSLSCRGNLGDGLVHTNTYSTCMESNRLMPGVNITLHSSQPAYCGQR